MKPGTEIDIKNRRGQGARKTSHKEHEASNEIFSFDAIPPQFNVRDSTRFKKPPRYFTFSCLKTACGQADFNPLNRQGEPA